MQCMGLSLLLRVIKVWIVFSAWVVLSPAYGSSVAIPVESVEEPAADLLYQKNAIDRGEAIDLASAGVDLSTLDPIPNDLWHPEALPAVQDGTDIHYPENGATVVYDSALPSSQGLYRSRVLVPGENVSRPFQMFMSLTGHASLARNALLRRLGYTIPSPRYFPTLKVEFKDIASRDSFLDSLSDATLTARKRWIQGDLPEDSLTVNFQDVVLEPAQINVPMPHWGAAGPTHLKGKRAIRALIVPLVLLDVQESVNLFSYELGKILNQSVLLTFPYADSFAETTFQDAAWIARRIAALSREDLQEVVQAGKYPNDVGALVLEKLVARRNHMVQLFNLADSMDRKQRKLPYDTKISVGNVKKGKLTVGTYDGFAARFSYGDPDSPLRMGELGRYFLMSTISGGLSALSSQVSHYMQVQSTDQVVADHQQSVVAEAQNWATQHPGTPFVQSLGSWGGPFGGFGIQANRSVITGNYYGSTAKVQLVDSIGVSASIGYFQAFSGIPIVIPTVSGNLQVQRNYVHVRPVPDMTDALKNNWGNIFVPYFMNHVASILDEPKPKPGETTVSDAESVENRLTKFLDALKDGEMLIVADSLVVGVKGQINIPIPILVDPSLILFNPSFGVGVGTRPTILRRTMFTRTEEGVQVYIQTSKLLNWEVEFNFNWYLNVLRLSHEDRQAMADTRAFLLDRGITAEPDRRKLLVSLRSLLKWNNSEILSENFKEHKINHNLAIGINTFKGLWWKNYTLKEGHRVKVELPEHPEAVRTLYSDRVVINKGVSPYSFFGDIVTAISSGIVNIPQNYGPNAANSPLGFAQWVNITTEAETTPGSALNPVSLIENYWGGWLLSKKGLMKVLDLLEAKAQSLNLDKPLIRRDEFETMHHMELYNIFSTIIIYESGMDKIRKTLFNPSFTEAVNGLIEVEGKDEMDRWCAKPGRKFINTVFLANSFSEKTDGHRVRFKCLKPWMRKALEVRQDVMRKKYPETPEGRVHWQNRLMKIFHKYLDLDKFLKWVSKDGYFFQIKVAGFRTKDENGDSEYISDSMGTFNEKEGAGAFRDFAAKYGIMAYELYARYLAEGYMGF